MNAQKKIDTDAKLISYTLNSFSSEAEMDLFVNFFEKNGKEFFENLKRYGLIRWRLNQVWNKDGMFQLASLFEYKDEEAYKNSIDEIVQDKRALVAKQSSSSRISASTRSPWNNT